AAEHARLPGWRIVEHAGLAGRHALLAAGKLHFVPAIDRAQPCRLRGTGRTHAHEHLETVADRTLQRTVTDPVDVAQYDRVHPQSLARADNDAAGCGVEPDHVKRRAGGD